MTTLIICLVMLVLSTVTGFAWKLLFIYETKRKQNVSMLTTRILLLVTAHPDDESMFFVPTLKSFHSNYTYILCLSNGNGDGLGAKRKVELETCSSSQFGISKDNVFVIDNEKLQDGKSNLWHAEDVSQLVYETLVLVSKRHAKDNGDGEKHSIMVATFDEHGVSHHPNHVATHFGVKRFASQFSEQLISLNAAAYKLYTVPIAEKFVGPLSFLWNNHTGEDENEASSKWLENDKFVFVNSDLYKSYRAMACHYTQFVWYRRLFITFSRYTFVNNLHRI
mmetsp:Transcript_13010/g.16888  ORF Transcript_13010/g.16888 Transcript_13010/m.16888 type:complete len:279 (-) Transcript_13010:470-1306(-)